MWLAAVFALCGAQADAGVPLPPLSAEQSDLPRVFRADGMVCIEALDAGGAVHTHCRAEKEAWQAPPRPVMPPERLGPRGVMSVNLGLGVLTADGVTLPEASFLVDAGVLFSNGAGIVGLVHAHLSPLLALPDVTLLHRYGLGAALRLGARSHFLLGVSGTLNLVQDLGLRASPSLSIVMKGAIVVSDAITVQLMPVFGFAEGVSFSISAGIGASL